MCVAVVHATTFVVTYRLEPSDLGVWVHTVQKASLCGSDERFWSCMEAVPHCTLHQMNLERPVSPKLLQVARPLAERELRHQPQPQPLAGVPAIGALAATMRA